MSDSRSTVPKPANEPVLTYAPGTAEKIAVKAELEHQLANPASIRVEIGETQGSGSGSMDVTCPHDHKHVLAQCQQATDGDVELAIKSSLSARLAWAALPWEDRASVFLKAADLLATKYRAAINSATMLGQGKTVHQAEIDAACELIDFLRFNAHYAEQIYTDQPSSSRGCWNRLQSRGLEGFVYAIAPFNFTAISVNLPTAPALMGCSVIWKPAATAVHSSYIAYQVLREAGLPPGVINFLPGDARAISKHLLKHPDLAGIHFTGSTATFNYLWQTVGENIANYKTYPRIVGETGGKDFVFAHASADPEQLVTALIRGAFEYQGQKCSAASRAYIPRSLWPQVKDALVAQAEELKMGEPMDFTNFVGAVIDKRSFDKDQRVHRSCSVGQRRPGDRRRQVRR